MVALHPKLQFAMIVLVWCGEAHLASRPGLTIGHHSLASSLQARGDASGRADSSPLPQPERYGLSIVFDGSRIWAADWRHGRVVKLRTTDGQILGRFDAGENPFGLASDGVRLWVACLTSSNLVALKVEDGAQDSTFQLGEWPFGVVFDGSAIWVTATRIGRVFKLRP